MSFFLVTQALVFLSLLCVRSDNTGVITRQPHCRLTENLTIKGLSETSVNIGDRFRIGTAEVMVTQPRFPCFKLNLKFGRDDMVKRFLNSRLSGIYFSVVREGEVGAGDAIELVSRDENNVTVADIVQIYVREANEDLVRRAIQVTALAASLKDYFQQQIE